MNYNGEDLKGHRTRKLLWERAKHMAPNAGADVCLRQHRITGSNRDTKELPAQQPTSKGRKKLGRSFFPYDRGFPYLSKSL